MKNDAFDMEGALTSLGGDEKLLGELVSIYVDSLQERMSAIARALSATEAVDLETVAHVAHNLLGSSGTVGAMAVAATAKALDTAARSEDAVTVREIFAQLERDVADFLEAKDSAL